MNASTGATRSELTCLSRSRRNEELGGHAYIKSKTVTHIPPLSTPAMIQSYPKIDGAQAGAALPDDVDALKALVIQQRLALITRDTEIEQLRFLIAKLKCTQ